MMIYDILQRYPNPKNNFHVTERRVKDKKISCMSEAPISEMALKLK